MAKPFCSLFLSGLFILMVGVIMFGLPQKVQAASFYINFSTTPYTPVVSPGASVTFHAAIMFTDPNAVRAPFVCTANQDLGSLTFFQGGVLEWKEFPPIQIYESKSYQLTCTDAQGETEVSDWITVTVSSKPIVTVTANPAELPLGGGTTSITWTVGNATRCVQSGGNSAWLELRNMHVDRGRSITTTLTTTTYFDLECFNDSGASSGLTRATVTVGGVSGPHCTDAPGIVRGAYASAYPGDQEGLTENIDFLYSSTNTARKCEFSCTAEAEWREVVIPASGIRYWTCALKAGPSPGPSPSINFYADKQVVRLGEEVSLHWSASGIADGGGCDRVSNPNSSLVGWEGRMEKSELERGGQVTFVPTNASRENATGTYKYSLCNITVAITVQDPPVITMFTANPTTLDSGQTSTLGWDTSANTIECHLFQDEVRVNPRGGPAGVPLFIKTKDGSSAVTPDTLIWSGRAGRNTKEITPTATRDYTLICYGAPFEPSRGIGYDTKTVRVTVNGTPNPDDGNGNPGDGKGEWTTDFSCPAPNTCTTSCAPSNRLGLCSETGGNFCCRGEEATSRSGTPPTPTTGSFRNLLGFTTVDGFFTSILGFLQGLIVTLALIFIIIGGFLYITSAGNEGRTETAKKAILAALIGLALGIAAPTFLKEVYTILGASGTVPSSVTTSLSLLQIASNILSFLLTLIGILAIIMLVIGGILYLTAAGSEDQIDRGKKIVKYALIGIFVALAALVLVKQVAKFFVAG